jgi:hypothetical protein
VQHIILCMLCIGYPRGESLLLRATSVQPVRLDLPEGDPVDTGPLLKVRRYRLAHVSSLRHIDYNGSRVRSHIK